MTRGDLDRARLSAAEINRATLARQMLLVREPIGPAPATSRLAGLQAQEPASPSIALWSRIDGFDASSLADALQARDVVKATLMRGTLHLATADDYRHFLPAMAPMLGAISRRERGGVPDHDRLLAWQAAGLAFAATPRSNRELRAYLAALAPEYAPEDAWWWIRRSSTFLHVPGDAPWSFSRRPMFVAAAAWLPDLVFADVPAALEHLIRRYLGALGPATVADIANWSRLSVARLRPAIDALEAANGLLHLTDDRGRDLLDLLDAPRPPADTPAPPRYLPMWDNLLLGHADRTRIVSDEHRARVIHNNGDTLPTFLVDGHVAGLWWAETDAPGATTRIVREPFISLSPSVERALDREGERLATFLAPLEPRVFDRYRRDRPRDG